MRGFVAQPRSPPNPNAQTGTEDPLMPHVLTQAERTEKALPSVLISILNWNSLEDTKRCLAVLLEDDTLKFDIVLIDNGSAIDPTAELRRDFPTVECVRLQENRGFAGGQNFGMDLAIQRGYAAVLLLNNDCQMATAHIQQLWRTLEADDSVAAVSPLIYWLHDRQRPQMVGGWLDWEKHVAVRPSQPGIAKPQGMPTLLNGTALLLRCSALKVIGLLDESYFAYYEDNEFSVRLAKHGLGAAYCLTAEAFHQQRPAHQYSAFALYLSARNAWTFWRSHTPEKFRGSIYKDVLSQNLLEIAQLKKAGEIAKCHAVVAGFWDAQRHRTGVPPKHFYSPFLLRWLMCVAPYLTYQLLRDPVALVKHKWQGLISKR